jgi:hypothetical protein
VKPTAEDLAAAIRELFRREDILGCQTSSEFEAVKWRWKEAREAVQALLDSLNGNAPESDRPAPQELERRIAELDAQVDCLSIANGQFAKRHAEQEARIAELQSRGTLYDLTDLRNECSRLGARVKELESREPAPAVEVDWDAMGSAAYQEFHHPKCTEWNQAMTLTQKAWKFVAKAVVAAYEAQKGAAKSG